MRIRHYSKGKFYVIECPDGTRVVPPSVTSGSVSWDHLIVPFKGQEITISADPDELLPLLAESACCGLSLIGEPVPDVNLAGVDCPNCGEDDVTWLQLMDEHDSVHCDRCGTEFDLADRPISTIPTSQPSGN